jgi:hypothetical protein
MDHDMNEFGKERASTQFPATAQAHAYSVFSPILNIPYYSPHYPTMDEIRSRFGSV